MSVEAINAVLSESRSTHSGRLVALVLAQHAHRDGTKAHPGLGLLKAETALSRSAIYGAITELKDLGELEETGKVGRATCYRLLLPALVQILESVQDLDAAFQNLDQEPSGKVGIDIEGHPDTTLEGVQREPLVAKAQRVWAHYSSVMKPRRRTLDPDGERIIVAALKVASVEDCLGCIDACAASEFHMKTGPHSGRKGGKYTTLGHIFKPRTTKGETQRDRIDFWLERKDEDKVDEYGWKRE